VEAGKNEGVQRAQIGRAATQSQPSPMPVLSGTISSLSASYPPASHFFRAAQHNENNNTKIIEQNDLSQRFLQQQIEAMAEEKKQRQAKKLQKLLKKQARQKEEKEEKDKRKRVRRQPPLRKPDPNLSQLNVVQFPAIIPNLTRLDCSGALDIFLKEKGIRTEDNKNENMINDNNNNNNELIIDNSNNNIINNKNDVNIIDHMKIDNIIDNNNIYNNNSYSPLNIPLHTLRVRDNNVNNNHNNNINDSPPHNRTRKSVSFSLPNNESNNNIDMHRTIG